MHECPICHNPGIPTWRKLCLGPAVPTKCRQCGRKGGVSYSSLFALVPLIISILISYYIFLFTKSFLWIILVLIVGNSIMFILYWKCVPLIPKE